jgi:hypothetical protein
MAVLPRTSKREAGFFRKSSDMMSLAIARSFHVMAGLVPAISIHEAPRCLIDRRDKPGDDAGVRCRR